MQIKRYNISKPKKYTSKNGEEKTQWNNIGTMTEFYKDNGDISRIIEIPAVGLEANIFPFQPKEQRGGRPEQQDAQNVPTVNIDEEIKAEDLPF